MATNVGSISYTLELDTRKFDSSIAAIKGKLDGLKGSLSSTDSATRAVGDSASSSSLGFGKLAAAFGIGQIAANALTSSVSSVFNAIKDGVTQSASLQAGLGQLQSITGATNTQMAQLKQTAVALGKDFTLPGVSAKDAADAMIEFSKNGIQLNDVLSGSKSVLQLAKLANIDYASSARTVATALNSFGLNGKEASNVSNTLAKTSAASGATLQELSEAFAQTSAVARQSGLSFNDTSTALGLLAKNGLRGSDAGTSLKTALIRLNAPTQEVKDGLKALGVNAFDSSGKTRSFSDIVDDLANATKGLSDEQRSQALSSIFGQDAIRAGTILTRDGAGAFDDFSKKILKSAGASDQLAARSKGLQGIFEILKSNIDTAFLGFGDTISKVIEPIIKFVNLNFDTVIAGIAGIAAGILVLAGPSIIAGLSALAASLGAISAALLANPILLAIAAIVAALVFLETKFGVFSKLFEIIKPVIDFIATEFKKAWDEAAIAVGQLMVALQPFIDQLKIALAPVIQFIKDNFDQLKPVFQALIILVTGPLAVMFAPFLLALGVVFAALKLLPPIINAIIGTINFFRDIFLAVSNTVISVATTMGNVFTSVSNTIRGAINTIIAAVQGLAGAISGAISSAINIVRGFVGQFTSAGANLIQGLVNGIRSGISSAISAISSAASAIKDKFTSALGIKSPSTIFAGYGQNILQGLTNGMVDNIRSAVGTISKVAKSVNGSFKDSLDIQLPPIEVQPSKFNIGQTQSSLNDLVSQIQSPTAGLSPVVSSPTTTIQPTTIAGITPQKQVIIAAVPINGIQLTKEQLRDFYRELTTAYGEDLGAIV